MRQSTTKDSKTILKRHPKSIPKAPETVRCPNPDYYRLSATSSVVMAQVGNCQWTNGGFEPHHAANSSKALPDGLWFCICANAETLQITGKRCLTHFGLAFAQMPNHSYESRQIAAKRCLTARSYNDRRPSSIIVPNGRLYSRRERGREGEYRTNTSSQHFL